MATIEQVRPLDLQAWFARHSTGGVPVVLDVREPWEWQTARVASSPSYELVHCSMRSLAAYLEQASPLTPERPIACLCHHGQRSMHVAQFLAQQGFTQLANIAGGIQAWAEQLDPKVPKY